MIFNERFPVFEQTNDRFLLSTDPQKFDVEVIYAYLSEEAYWSPGVKRAVIDRAFNFSLCFGIYEVDNGRYAQAAFARVTTDYAKFAYIADVFVLDKHRGNGLGKWLIKCILHHPELVNVGWWHLHTRDAQGLYSQFGFSEYPEPHKYMTMINKKNSE